ncbi:MAG: 4Fe-4S cluster-binding domain-containing protein, partial [Staphylococcus epidermidis]|nr:4Fe-4S cluster-binding domain-containing protein [Staphylococcus epidermidis]
DDARKSLLEHIDVLVDGMFIQHLYRPNLPYKGSLNQRVIDVQSSLQKEQVIEYLTK